MEIPIRVEPKPEGGFIARGETPLELSAEGTTIDAALAAFDTLMRQRLGRTASRLILDRTSDPPTYRFVPVFDPNDPVRQAWREAVADDRRKMDGGRDFPGLEPHAAPRGRVMRFPILVEPKDGGGFRAKCGPPWDVVADGETCLEAVQRVEDSIRARRAAGAELYWAEVPETPSVMKYAGMLKDDESTREYLAAVEEHRRKCDAEPPLPWMTDEPGKAAS